MTVVRQSMDRKKGSRQTAYVRYVVRCACVVRVCRRGESLRERRVSAASYVQCYVQSERQAMCVWAVVRSHCIVKVVKSLFYK